MDVEVIKKISSNDVIIYNYNNEEEMLVDQICSSLKAFVIDTNIVTEKEHDLLRAVQQKNYVGFYKLIRKISRKAISNLDKHNHRGII